MLPHTCLILPITPTGVALRPTLILPDAMTKLDSPVTAPLAGPAQDALIRALARRAPVAGRHATAWPGLHILREDHPHHTRIPYVLEPCVIIVAQGRKRAYLGNEAFTYDPLHYLVVAVPLPMETVVVEASPDRPYLSLALRLQAAAISELLLETGDGGRRGNGVPPRGLYVSPLSDALSGAVLRLMTALDDPTDRRVLAPMAEREVLYHLLVGEQGERLRAIALRDSQAQRIAQVLHFLQTHFDQPLDVATIADVAHMSPSTLHHTFRAVTNSSPLQYLKKIRLHQARLLMLSDGLGAGEAARRVGYGSDSQFSREYRRLFGVPPSLDVATWHAEANPVSES